METGAQCVMISLISMMLKWSADSLDLVTQLQPSDLLALGLAKVGIYSLLGILLLRNSICIHWAVYDFQRKQFIHKPKKPHMA